MSRELQTSATPVDDEGELSFLTQENEEQQKFPNIFKRMRRVLSGAQSRLQETQKAAQNQVERFTFRDLIKETSQEFTAALYRAVSEFDPHGRGSSYGWRVLTESNKLNREIKINEALILLQELNAVFFTARTTNESGLPEHVSAATKELLESVVHTRFGMEGGTLPEGLKFSQYAFRAADKISQAISEKLTAMQATEGAVNVENLQTAVIDSVYPVYSRVVAAVFNSINTRGIVYQEGQDKVLDALAEVFGQIPQASRKTNQANKR